MSRRTAGVSQRSTVLRRVCVSRGQCGEELRVTFEVPVAEELLEGTLVRRTSETVSESRVIEEDAYRTTERFEIGGIVDE